MKTKSQIETRLKKAEHYLDNPSSPEAFRHTMGFVEALEATSKMNVPVQGAL